MSERTSSIFPPVVTLDPDTLYKFCGNVDVGANILDLPPSSVAAGDDPLVDSVTGTQSTVFRLSEGGTVKDLAIRNAELVGSAILVGGSVAPVQAAVFFNISVNAADQGTLIIGQIAAITFARYKTPAMLFRSARRKTARLSAPFLLIRPF